MTKSNKSCMIHIYRIRKLKSVYNYILLDSSPWRIVSDCGGAFTMGCVGGALFGFVGGARNAPAGFNRRAIGGLVRMRERYHSYIT